MTPPAAPSPGSGDARGATWAMVLAFTLASAFGFNAYQYGIGDTSISIPFAEAAADARFYPGDYLLAQRPYYYTYLWDALGWIHAHAPVSLETLFFGAYMIALLFTFLGLHALAMTLFRRRDAAALALVFLLAGKHTLGSVYTIERVLSTRQAALPLLLFSLAWFLRGRSVGSGILLGLAYLIHPITTHYALAMIVVAGLFGAAPSGRRSALACLLAFGVVASPLIFWRITHTPPSERLFSVDPRWLEAIRLRSANHMLPSTWDAANWIQALVVIVLFGFGWSRRGPGHPERHRAMRAFGATVVALCLVGIVFSEIVPLGGVLLTQPLRSFQFMEYFAMLYVAHALAGTLERQPSRRDALVVIAAGGLFIAPHFEPPGLILYAVSIVLLLVWRMRAARPLRAPRVELALAALAVCAAVAVGMNDLARNHAWAAPMADAQEPAWLDVQRWARSHTRLDDAFIVPPALDEEFRVESERTVYADREEGGLMNGDPAFGVEWLRRMRRLGMEGDFSSLGKNYRRLDAPRIASIAGELGLGRRHVWFVTQASAAPLPFAMHYRNRRYIVYEVTRTVPHKLHA